MPILLSAHPSATGNPKNPASAGPALQHISQHLSFAPKANGTRTYVKQVPIARIGYAPHCTGYRSGLENALRIDGVLENERAKVREKARTVVGDGIASSNRTIL